MRNIPRSPYWPPKLTPLAAAAAVPLRVEMRGGEGRPILAARWSGRRRRAEGKRHGPAGREGAVRLRGRMLAAQLTVESPRTKSSVAGERDDPATAASKQSRTERKRRRSAMPGALWREPVAGVRGEVEDAPSDGAVQLTTWPRCLYPAKAQM